jgi:hypothetical protein
MDEPGQIYVNGVIDHIIYLIFLSNTPKFRLLSIPQKTSWFTPGFGNLQQKLDMKQAKQFC